MKAYARLVAVSDGRGGTRITGLRSAAPLLVRPTAQGVYLVGGAAGPLGGDRLRLEIQVGRGACLTVRTAAASVVLPGPAGEESLTEVEAVVGDEGCLRWLPEPVVATARCRHRTAARVAVGCGGRLVWREELILGRHGERPGALSSRLSVEVAARPVLRQELAVGSAQPGWGGPAVTGASRAVGSVVMVDPRWQESSPQLSAEPIGERAVVLALPGPAVQVLALCDGAVTLRRLLDTGLGQVERAVLTAGADDSGRRPAS